MPSPHPAKSFSTEDFGHAPSAKPTEGFGHAPSAKSAEGFGHASNANFHGTLGAGFDCEARSAAFYANVKAKRPAQLYTSCTSRFLRARAFEDGSLLFRPLRFINAEIYGIW